VAKGGSGMEGLREEGRLRESRM